MTSPKYGGRGRDIRPEFIEYMKKIVFHPNYKGMPWAIDNEGKIRWNAPSHRPPGGTWSNLHEERLDWWKKKAKEIGVPVSGKWIAEVAKKIHPFKEKPCQTCGQILSIEYRYPTRRTLDRINAIPGIDPIDHEDFQTISQIATDISEQLGQPGLKKLASILNAPGTTTISLDSFLNWLENDLMPREPRGVLSPGAMADPPDRLDGFHTYNICCRHKEDTGRTPKNLKTYGLDRRAFEYWCEGDWAAADYLMKQTVRGHCESAEHKGKDETTLTADHLGPLSLGFRHRPYFRAFCGTCNSTRNNRLTVADVRELLDQESKGEDVVSWQVKSLWRAYKKRVKIEKDAAALTEMMRVAQHEFLTLLARIKQLGCVGYLQSLLHPEYALNKYQLVGFTGKNYSFDKMLTTERHVTYAKMKMERVTRIALDSLDDYGKKANRRIVPIVDEELQKTEDDVLLEATKAISSGKYEELQRKVSDYNALVAQLLIERGVPRGYDAHFD